MTSSIEPKKILYQLVSPLHVVAGASEVERRQAMLRRWASPSVSIDIASPQEGPPVIESQIDAALLRNSASAFRSCRRIRHHRASDVASGRWGWETGSSPNMSSAHRLRICAAIRRTPSTA